VLRSIETEDSAPQRLRTMQARILPPLAGTHRNWTRVLLCVARFRLTAIGYCVSVSNGEVHGRVVAVTGASGGVGRAVVREFAKRGDSIALLSRGEVGGCDRG
jgi:NADPH:quinone reductase-like Zn-dependent oxidoreductase